MRLMPSDSGKDKPPFGFRNGPAKVLRGFDPFRDDNVHVLERGLLGRAVGGAAGQFRHFGDERLVRRAPVDNDLMFGFSHFRRLCFEAGVSRNAATGSSSDQLLMTRPR